MMNHLKSLAYDVQNALSARSVQITRAQAHEGLAALLGYRSVAAMKADPAVSELEGCFALILDNARAMKRLTGFGVPKQYADLAAQGVPQRLEELILASDTSPRRVWSPPSRLVFGSMDDFLDDYQAYAEDVVYNSEEASSEMAMTNATFEDIDIDAVEISISNFHALQPGDQFELTAEAAMSGDQIDEKLWTDNDLLFSITTTFEKVGKVGVRHVSDSIEVLAIESDGPDV